MTIQGSLTKTRDEFLKEMSHAGHNPLTIGFVAEVWGREIGKTEFITLWQKEVQSETHPLATSTRRGLELYDYLAKFGAIRINER